MRKVYHERMEALEVAIRCVADGGVSVYELTHERGKPSVWGVNWSAMGTQPVEMVEAQIEFMRMAADIANTLNRLEVMFIYGKDDEDCDPDFETYEDFQNEIEKIKEQLKNGKYRYVDEFLLRGEAVYRQRQLGWA